MAMHKTVASSLLFGARERSRLAEIAAVLVREGAGVLAHRLGVAGALGVAERGALPGDLPHRTVRALQELGPVFVKLGQVLSTRSDLLPGDWIEALETLQARVAPIDWEQAEAALCEALGDHPDALFERFDREPLGSASIAQVYRARTRDGAEVVVKLRRPDLRARIDSDLRILAFLAEQAEANSPGIARLQPVSMMRNLADALRAELDFVNEGRNCETLAQGFAGRSDVVFPKVHWTHSGAAVLVMDFIDGISPSDPQKIVAAGLDGPTLARSGADCFLRMAMVHGVFHADPHPGNLLALPGNKVGFIDFGSVGRLSEKRREELVHFVEAVVESAPETLARLLKDWSATGQVDGAALESDADAFIARHRSDGLDLSAAISDLMRILRVHRLLLPADLVLLFKALATADGVMKRLDPAFDVVAAARPMVHEAWLRKLDPQRLMRKALTALNEATQVAQVLPGMVRRVDALLQSGRLIVELQAPPDTRLPRAIMTAGGLIAAGIVLGALIVALAPFVLPLTPLAVPVAPDLSRALVAPSPAGE